MLAARCVSAEVRDKLAAEMKWYDDYLPRAAWTVTPTPPRATKRAAVANIVEKAMGSIAKSGTSPHRRSSFSGRKAYETRPDLCRYSRF